MTKVFQQNRLHNARNPNQGEFKKVLCVCSAGILRSPTAAWVLANPPFNFNTRAAGLHHEWALIPVDDTLIHWAHEIVVMTEDHFDVLHERFVIPPEKKVFMLDVPDIYEYRDPELVELITRTYIARSDWGRGEIPGEP